MFKTWKLAHPVAFLSMGASLAKVFSQNSAEQVAEQFATSASSVSNRNGHLSELNACASPLFGALAGVDSTAALPGRARGHGALLVAQAEERRPVAAGAGDLAGDGRKRGPALAAPEIAGLGDLDLVPLGLPDRISRLPGSEPLLRRRCPFALGAGLCRKSASSSASRRSTDLEKPPWSSACHFQAMPSIRSRRRAPFGGGLPQAATRPAAGRRSTGRAGLRPAPPAPGRRRRDIRAAGLAQTSAWIRPPGPGDRPCASPWWRSARRSPAGGAG